MTNQLLKLMQDLECAGNTLIAQIKGLTVQTQIYTYPNGIQSTNRPVDGQVFYNWDSSGHPLSIWQWDSNRDQWIRVDDEKEPKLDLEKSFKSMLNCECGAESCGSNKHSSYCQKYQS
jgi:hypothetical protein